MSRPDTMSLILVFVAVAICVTAIVLRYSDSSFRIKVIAGRALLALSLLHGLASVFLISWSDMDNLPAHTVDGLTATVSFSVVLIFNVLKMFPPISMRD